MSEAKFEHIGITVRDIEKTVKWYKDIFGFEEIRKFDKPDLELKGAVIKLGDFSIELLQPYKVGEKFYAENGLLLKNLLHKIALTHLALSVSDINSTYKKLKESSIAFITEIVDLKYFFCKDPDGFLIEVKQGK